MIVFEQVFKKKINSWLDQLMAICSFWGRGDRIMDFVMERGINEGVVGEIEASFAKK